MAKISRLNPILEALRANPDKIQRISIQRDTHRPKLREIILLAKEKGIPLDFVPKQDLDRLVPAHQGALAVLTSQAYVSLEEVLARAENPFFLLLDGITDPQNLGAIIRSAECGGVDGVVLPERRSAGVTESVMSVSAGAAEHIPISRIKNLARTMEWLRKNGVWLVGAEGGAEECWTDFDYTLPVALVLGSEGKGLRPLVREKCDKILSLPVYGKINSLNVASAASVFIYEVLRQRNFSK